MSPEGLCDPRHRREMSLFLSFSILNMTAVDSLCPSQVQNASDCHFNLYCHILRGVGESWVGGRWRGLNARRWGYELVVVLLFTRW